MAKARKPGTLKRALRERDEALRFQAATQEILASISGSVTDAKPVFSAIIRSVLRLFGTRYAAVFLIKGDEVHLADVTNKGPRAAGARFRAAFPQKIDYSTFTGKALRSGKVSQLVPIIGNPKATPQAVKLAKTFGYDCLVVAPLVREGKVIGAIGTSHPQARRFTDEELALLKGFADQAVIAIENARLFNETKEALERQTATADILKVISSSPTDVQPVFQAVAERAAQLCNAENGSVLIAEGAVLRGVATVGLPLPFREIPIRRTLIHGRAFLERRTIHIEDVLPLFEEYPDTRDSQSKSGFRTLLSVPMLREGRAIGTIGVWRREVKAFSREQIELLETFAAQAVIAIENVRLFNETKEALEHQKASADVLKIVASSVESTDPVFTAITEAGTRLVPGARVALMLVRDGEVHYVSHSGVSEQRRAEVAKYFPLPLHGPRSIATTAILEKRVVHVPDMEALGKELEVAEKVARASGWRALLTVPLLSEGEAIGTISVTREQPGPFSDKQIELAKTFADQAVIALQNARMFNETKNALARQTATADILRVIGSSVTDVQPVFDAIVKNCNDLFPGAGVILRLVSGDQLVVKAHIAYDAGVLPIDRTSASGACVLEGRTIHLPDLDEAAKEFPRIRQLGLKYGYRSGVNAPLMRGGTAIGGISVLRPEHGAFDEREVQLLTTFADQAVIAIENVRLFNETKEALEQQTAGAEILRVISDSPGNLAPVFQAILKNALRLCQAHYGAVFMFDGTAFDAVASAYARGGDSRLQSRIVPGRETPLRLAGLERRTVHTADLLNDPRFSPPEEYHAEGMRAALAVPLLKDDKLVGALAFHRLEVGAFTDKQIGLVETFAAQAVIAIENARLFNETKEALEQQTATADILRVISSTPTDTQPVFEAIVQSAQRLIRGNRAVILLRRDSRFEAVAMSNTDPRTIPDDVRLVPLDRDKNFPSRAILDGEVVHVPDWHAADVPEFERGVAKAYGVGSGVLVPLLRQGVGIGALAVARESKGAYHEKEISLLRSFADQAVIAIENARLFNETKQALERQTATSDILRVISSSPTDIQPVFDAVVANAARLCNARNANVFRVEGDLMRLVSKHGPVGTTLGVGETRSITRGSISGRAVLERRTVHVEDALAVVDAEYPQIRDSIRREGLRTVIGIPLLREGLPIGAITVYRTEAQPFSEEQVALLQTFAQQAVIAIENVRLFNETKEALERQTATSEILRVISASPTDVQPVFDAIVASGMRLFQDAAVAVSLPDGQQVRLAAIASADEEQAERWRKVFPFPLVRERMHGMAILDNRLVDFPDVELAAEVGEEGKKAFLSTGNRAITVIPMLRDNAAIGAISVIRRPAGALTDKQMQLLATFADQAVIAIENTRLFTELQTSNRDLTKALDTQTATSDILRVISRSQTDVQPVFDAIVRSAVRLLRGYSGALSRVSGDEIVLTANTSTDETGDAATKALFPLPLRSEFPHAQAIRAGTPFNVADARTDGRLLEDARAYAHVRGYRSWIVVPMLRQNEAIGAIGVTRREAGGFTDDEIALLQTFADQAVIAIENVRLFNETKEALEQQIATAEILKVMSGTPTDTQPVFDAIARSALRIFGGMDVSVGLVDGDAIHIRAGTLSSTGRGPGARMRLDRDTYAGRVILDRSEFNIADVEAPDTPPVTRERARLAGWRSIAIVPMLREGVAMGLISIHRSEPVALDEKQFALLRTFADQAVIAIENVRLFKELEARTQALTKSVGQLTALGEVGQAISSTLDLETVLKTIVSHAVKLTGLDAGAVYEYDEQGEAFHLRAAENLGEEIVEVLRTRPIRKGDGVVGRTAVTREPLQIHDTQDESYQSNLRELVIRTGRRALLAVPLMREDHIIGALTVQRNTPGPFAPEVVELLKTFATQSAMAIQNARLFREIEEKGRELGVASQHKSQFLASMSHELRTPLNALLGFNEMLLGDVYGEVPGDMKPPLAQMQSSGKHLLRLINNVLDLAKIEAGRMELALSEYSVHDTVESVRSTLHPLAADKGLEFRAAVQPEIPLAYGDPGRITQCLMNLAGNSLKFTKAGKVEISVALNNGHLRYCVADTGIGIAPDKMQGLFTEFKQTDATIASEYGGTGLGLSISKKFVEMHGGRIWAESEPGRGSTFIFEIPLRAREGKSA